MAINKLSIEQFLELAAKHPVLDVRSPGEYQQAHIPGAHSFPLFTDEERKVVGTAYKQQNRETAVKIGLDYFGVKMRSMVEQAETIARKDKTLLVHCWRGGMRSAGVAWLMDLYGFKVYTLAGGYKAYRQWVLQQFDRQWDLRILGGYTGSGKTEALQKLRPHIDLESIAVHRGSAFGDVEGKTQPRQEMFENLLATELVKQEGNTIWLEDESQRIGLVNIPQPFWKQMRNAKVYFVDIPFEQRLEHIVKGYGKQQKPKLVNSIMRIQKRLGGLDTKNAVNYLLEDDIKGCFSILLKYYDKQYSKALQERTAQQIQTIPCPTTDAVQVVTTLTEHLNN
ncbi:MAG: tRNA 2-selenouridine(34) synthase MnmH [Bacteroidetes bacterium]|nr:tRNA 2-selenouridine(34) synthase MnmH [Bacteroidota bacterium]